MFSSDMNETDMIMLNYKPYRLPSIRPYRAETVVSSTWLSYFPALIFLFFGIYNTFCVCMISENYYSKQLSSFIAQIQDKFL